MKTSSSPTAAVTELGVNFSCCCPTAMGMSLAAARVARPAATARLVESFMVGWDGELLRAGELGKAERLRGSLRELMRRPGRGVPTKGWPV